MENPTLFTSRKQARDYYTEVLRLAAQFESIGIDEKTARFAAHEAFFWFRNYVTAEQPQPVADTADDTKEAA
ncbi:MAG: hypothetical protein H7Y38_16070 [Armatimonadetes bacterium]|nr:hypothetical protein [Armatimonadota bacterium]